MLVMSQLPIQTTKIFYSFFDVHLCPHFEKGSATYVYDPVADFRRSETNLLMYLQWYIRLVSAICKQL